MELNLHSLLHCFNLEKQLNILPEYIRVSKEYIYCDDEILGYDDIYRIGMDTSSEMYKRLIGNRVIVPLCCSPSNDVSAYLLGYMYNKDVYRYKNYAEYCYIIFPDAFNQSYLIIDSKCIITNAFSSNKISELLLSVAANIFSDRSLFKFYFSHMAITMKSIEKEGCTFCGKKYTANYVKGEIYNSGKRVILNIHTGLIRVTDLVDLFFVCRLIYTHSRYNYELPDLPCIRLSNLVDVPVTARLPEFSGPVYDADAMNTKSQEKFESITSDGRNYIDLSISLVSYLKSKNIRYTKASVEEICRVFCESGNLNMQAAFDCLDVTEELDIKKVNDDKKSGQVSLFCKKNNITEEYFWEHEADNFCKILECSKEELDTELGQFIN